MTSVSHTDIKFMCPEKTSLSVQETSLSEYGNI